MAGEKVVYNGSPTEYQQRTDEEWNPKVRNKQRDVSLKGIDNPPGGKDLPANCATGAQKVAQFDKDALYGQPDMGPMGASKPWTPPGRR